MPESTCSVWKITHGATVLLDHGDRLLSEPDFGFGKEVEVAQLLRGEHVAIFDRGNVSRDWSWSRIVRRADLAASREWRMSHDVEVAALGKADITVEVLNGASYLLKDAVVQTMRTASGRDVSGHNADVQADYNVVGGKLELVAN